MRPLFSFCVLATPPFSLHVHQGRSQGATRLYLHHPHTAAAKAKQSRTPGALRTTCQKCANKMRGVCEWPQFASDAPRFSNRCHDSSHWNRTIAHGHTHATAGYTRHFAHKPPQSAARPFTRVPSSHMPRVDARPLAFGTQRSARNSTLVLMARTRSATTDPSRPSPSSPREPARSQCCGPRAGQAS